jgi:hypothetical protein
MKMSKILILLGMLLFPLVSYTQILTPQPSPLAKMEQKVGLMSVSIEYSRPSARDRVVFGNLVPFGKYWRTGANAASKITFSEEVKVGESTIPAGTYSLFSMPNQNVWEIIFHSNTSYYGSGSEYDSKGEVARVSVTPSVNEHFVETFRIDINNINNSSAHIVIEWANTKVAVPFTVDTDKKVMSSIESVMSGPSARDYYLAAAYYNSEGKDYSQALVWVDKAIAAGMDQFWVLRLKSLIQANAGDFKGAIATAKESIKSAELANNSDYVKMNNDSIKEWTGK